MTQENQQRIAKATEELKEAFSDKLPVKFKKLHPDAKAPIRATDGAAGWDLSAVSYDCISKKDVTFFIKYHTGVSVEIPYGYVGLLFPRSSVYLTGMSLSNSVGVIDSDYRGEIFLFSIILFPVQNMAKVTE